MVARPPRAPPPPPPPPPIPSNPGSLIAARLAGTLAPPRLLRLRPHLRIWRWRGLDKGREGRATSSCSGDAVTRGSGPADLAAAGVQVPPRSGGEGALRTGEGDPHGGVERAVRALPSHRLR
jgi:hypothetical protein